MKLAARRRIQGFSIGEVMVTVAVSTMLLAATLTTSASLQKSFSAVDNFFGTHMQQIRIIDYLSRDVKRATIVTTSSSQQTVVCTVPNYIIGAADPEAIEASLSSPAVNVVGKRRNAVVISTANGDYIYYGNRKEDGVISNVNATARTATLTSASSKFNPTIVSYPIGGINIPDGTTATYASANSLTITSPVGKLMKAGTEQTFVLTTTSTVNYAVTGQKIERSENGVVTTIAASTDRLVPKVDDMEDLVDATDPDELRNTEHALISVTFLPTFNFNGAGGGTPSAAETIKRNGTSVLAKAYLRNKRRG